MKYVIARFENNICLNPKEFILEDDNKNVKTFNSPQDACDFLATKSGELKTPDEWEEEGIYIEEEEV